MDVQSARNLKRCSLNWTTTLEYEIAGARVIVFKPVSETHVPHYMCGTISRVRFFAPTKFRLYELLERMRDSEISFDLAKIRRRLTKFSWRTFVEFSRLPRTKDEIRQISLSLFLHSTDNYCCEYKKLKIPKPYS